MGRRKVVIIIQARMKSNRLYGKVMKELAGVPLLGHVIDRMRRVNDADGVIVATTTNKEDDLIEKFANGLGMEVFRGSENDVLNRFICASEKADAGVVVRATADNPLSDPGVLTGLLKLRGAENAEYGITGGYPAGIGCDVFTFECLCKIYDKTKKAGHREHINDFILENPRLFKSVTLEAEGIYRKPEMRLTVDTEEDFNLMKAVFDRLYSPGSLINLKDVIMLVGSRGFLRRSK